SMEIPPRRASNAVAAAPQSRRGSASDKGPSREYGSGVWGGRGPLPARGRPLEGKLPAVAAPRSAIPRESPGSPEGKTGGPQNASASSQRPPPEARRPARPLPSKIAPAPQTSVKARRPPRGEPTPTSRSAATPADAARSAQCKSAEAPSRSPS